MPPADASTTAFLSFLPFSPAPAGEGLLNSVSFTSKGTLWQEQDSLPSSNAAAKTSPDADDTYSMFIFLSDKRDGIATMVDVITAELGYLYSVLPKAKAKHVNLQLPKFEIKFDWDLEGDLRRLGLLLPFLPEVADLQGMCENDDGRPTFLNKVAHRAVDNVNEAGTEAATITGIMCGGGGAPPDMVEFVADHSFTFFIMEELSGVIVFAGHILDPTK